MIIAITRSWGQNKHVLDPSYLYLAPGSCLCHWAVIAKLGAGVLPIVRVSISRVGPFHITLLNYEEYLTSSIKVDVSKSS